MPEGAISRDLKRAPRPDPPRPARPAPVRHLVPVKPASTPAARSVELGSEHLVSLPDDTEVRIRRLIAEELAPGPTRMPRDEATVRFQIPARVRRLRVELTGALAHVRTWAEQFEIPAQVRGLRGLVVGAIAFALVWNVTIGSYRAYIEAERARVRPIPPSAAPPVPVAAVAHRCATTAPHVLARAALVRGGVEAATSENRIGLGVVTGPREGVAMELDPALAMVKGSTKVVASDGLLRVLPAIETDLPLDATPEIGPMHAVAKGDDGETYETGMQDGFLVWRTRGRDASSRLWPMPADSEVPRAVRAGGDDVLVFRRGDSIWMGTVHVDRDGAHGGALARVSDPATQVGAPSADADGETVISAWSQRDVRGGRWTPRWVHWRHDARVGAVQQLTPPGADNAIAPSVAALADGRFLLAWTEGGAGHHRVRGQLFGSSDQAIGPVLDISAPGIDAGQAQLAIGTDGRGAAGYLVARGGRFDLVATPVACQ